MVVVQPIKCVHDGGDGEEDGIEDVVDAQERASTSDILDGPARQTGGIVGRGRVAPVSALHGVTLPKAGQCRMLAALP